MGSVVPPHTSYLICATQRTGSSLLCEALANTGLAGHPMEWFLHKDEPGYAEQWQVSRDFSEFFQAALEAGTTPNGVFGGKMMWSGFYEFVHKLAMAQSVRPRRGAHTLNGRWSKGERLRTYRRIAGRGLTYVSAPVVPVPELLSGAFPNLHYIYITRHDKVRQAISQLRVAQGEPWASIAEEQSRTRAEPQFDFHWLDRQIHINEGQEAAWEEYFREAGVEPFRVVYEALVPRYEQTALEILRFLDIPFPANLAFGPRRLEKQADALSEEWVNRYSLMKRERDLRYA